MNAITYNDSILNLGSSTMKIMPLQCQWKEDEGFTLIGDQGVQPTPLVNQRDRDGVEIENEIENAHNNNNNNNNTQNEKGIKIGPMPICIQDIMGQPALIGEWREKDGIWEDEREEVEMEEGRKEEKERGEELQGERRSEGDFFGGH